MDNEQVIEAAAKELFTIWHSHQVYLDTPLNEAFEMDKATWIEIAKHVIQEHVELFGMLTIPDHR